MLHLLLASASPRRREILSAMGIPFTVQPSHVDESAIPADHPRTLAIRLAYTKATAILPTAPPDSVILAADTVVSLEGVLFGKPAGEDEAAEMLRALSGRVHEVTTGVALALTGTPEVHLDSLTTRVNFKTLTEEQIRQYVQTREPLDKAGAYGIQGLGADLIDSISGDYYNVVGLPSALVAELLRQHTEINVPRILAPPARWAQP